MPFLTKIKNKIFIARTKCMVCNCLVGNFRGDKMGRAERLIPINSSQKKMVGFKKLGTSICPNCQPSCLHSEYCDTFKKRKCKFVKDMKNCVDAKRGILTGTCTCKAKHVTIWLAKDEKDFKKDKEGNYIRTCRKCSKGIDEASKNTTAAFTHGEGDGIYM